ncbi:MAG: undecaprenyldiphospho-muramoylpentapeptide beta-N-acetylglucosaminyltransferase [Pseudomonadota bacterium]
MAGGTGGHVYPGLAVAERLQDAGIAVAWLGTAEGIESRLVPAAGIALHTIRVHGLRGSGWRRWLYAPYAVGRAVVSALRVLRDVQPTAVLGFGGFASGPGGVAAWLTGRPLLVHEQNARPGLTNRLLARLARRVLEAFPNTFSGEREVFHTGNPVRSAIVRVAPYAPPVGTVRILVLGGSQGALYLNQTVPAALSVVSTHHPLQVWHQCGPAHLDVTGAAYRDAGGQAEVTAFIEDMAHAYAWAHLVIARAGAMTVAELAAAGRPALLVPFPYAVDDHQAHNAMYLADRDAAVWVRQAEADAANLAARLSALLDDAETLPRMAASARAAARPDAGACVAEHCREVMA